MKNRVQRLVERQDSYNLFCCFPHIPDTTYGEKFRDVRDERTMLGDGTFWWLDSIRPSLLVYRCGDDCYLESYLSSRFFRQFGYDQLHVGNPNPRLGCTENLIDGARAWRYFIAGCIGAQFCVPHQTPTLHSQLLPMVQHVEHVSPHVSVNSFGITLIAA